MQDRRPRAREVRGDARERERVDVCAQTGSCRRERPALEARRRTPTRRARSRAAAGGGRPSRALGAAAAARAGASPRPRCPRPSRGGGPSISSRQLQDALRPVTRRSARAPRCACSARPSAARSSAERSANAAIRAASSAGSSRRKRSSSAEAACRTPGSTRAPARSSPPPRRRPCPARRRACCSRAGRSPRAARAPASGRPARRAPPGLRAELVPQRQELAAVLPLQLGERRAVHGQLERRARGRGSGEARASIDVEPLRRRVAPEREQPEAVARTDRSRHENSERSIPWPIAMHLRRVERERAAVDARSPRSRRARRARASARRASSA